MLHKNVPIGDQHFIHNWEVVDIPARDALSVVAADIGKVVKVGLDYYILQATGIPNTWGYLTAPPPVKELPAAGTAGQVLSKVDASDYNVTWSNPPASSITGTFTPELAGQTTAGSFNYYASRYGHYTRIGNLVFFTAVVVISSVVSAAGGTLIMKGLPYPSSTNGPFPCTVFPEGGLAYPSGVVDVIGLVLDSNSHVSVFGKTTSGTVVFSGASLVADTGLYVTGCYLADPIV
jgi:hypothetical protein